MKRGRKRKEGGRKRDRSALDDILRFGQKPPPGFGQFDAPPDAIEELHPGQPLKRGDRRRGGRLRHAERMGGTGNVRTFGNGYENAELIEGHDTRIINSFD